ncbi:hypothetical protein DXV76_00480 [Rhodobacteraceae bacterium CCMM004]|nr:hypothetical protein DXV76_00480 [Rhodobacteraceae bacterium CCMM004]
MTRFGILWAPLALTAALAACAPVVPASNPSLDRGPVDTGRGVGFGDYEAYEAARMQRERDLVTGGSQPVIPAATTGAPGPVSSGPISSQELSAAGIPVGPGAAQPATSAPAATPAAAPVPAGAPGVAPVDLNNPGISDEQDFQAVSTRETIESDAARIAANRRAYTVIQPTAVPRRPGSNRPNIVAYALQTNNPVGQPLYSRSGRNAQAKFQRACAGYASSDLAQEDFLASGGPEKDRNGVDPDGDGFACYWDPTPFRTVRR